MRRLEAPTRAYRSILVSLLLVLVAVVAAPPAAAFELFEGRLQFHGFARSETRVTSKNFSPNRDWYLSQQAFTFNLEIEADILQDTWGWFDTVGAYARVEARFECIWVDGCGVFNSSKYYGKDSASRDLERMVVLGQDGTKLHSPTDVFTDGLRGNRSGFVEFSEVQPVSRAQPGNETLPFFRAPVFDNLFALGGGNILGTLEPLDVVPLVNVAKIREGFDTSVSNWTLGPVNRNARIRSLGRLNTVESVVPVVPLKPQIPVPDGGVLPYDSPEFPMGLWAPHHRVRDKIPDILRNSRWQQPGDGRAFNLSENELAWNHGQSQDEKEVKEAYLDVEMFDGRLFMRVGKQTIVWGKTELFRNQDQFNPQDVGLSSLPSLEESRVALWAFRGIYSFYDVGPFEDVRLELAFIYDDFESIDAGTCGEPYAVFLVCAGSLAFFSGGVTGAGLFGAVQPESPWDSWRGVEVGVRLEWRYGRFSFALTDFYGYSDIPYLNKFDTYERNVDPHTGQPLDALDRHYEDDGDLEQQALLFDPQNRTLFEFACSLSVGVAGEVIPALEDECALSVFNSSTPITTFAGVNVSVASAFSQAIAGTNFGGSVICGTAGLTDPDDFAATLSCGFTLPLVNLNNDAHDGPAPVPVNAFETDVPCANSALRVIFTALCLAEYLTNPQEALLGCGEFYFTDCDIDGVDIYNAEASVLFQAFPMFEPGGPVATRNLNGRLIMLPGSRGPGERGYDPNIDGCVGPLPKKLDPDQVCANSAELINPLTNQRFRSEMEALSYNLLNLLVAFGVNNDDDGDCVFGGDPLLCDFVRGIFGTTGITRNDLLAGGNGDFGRRSFVWAGGGPSVLQFNKRNVLGLAVDFAEDWSKTNWSFEMTYVADEKVGDNDSRTLFRDADIYNLTISFDRPTFVNFLNVNRTLLFNVQVFFQYRTGDGPLDVLATFTIFTGYFQDRLLTQLTAVHDAQSATGGIIANLTYRFSSNFDATFGLTGFYGGPGRARYPAFPVAIQNNGDNFKSRTSYTGLSVLKDRDEVSLVFRYTF